MILLEEGRLRLDEPVDRLLPELSGRQVLNRTLAAGAWQEIGQVIRQEIEPDDLMAMGTAEAA
ncbi:MAG: hypothetical protein ACYDA0_03130 [Candidatus Dormibacteraceae bacterium]